MSKKRVHEIAKELKQHGIELDNKEVVTELVSLGHDVKGHSSSLEDDQATTAVQRILDKRTPRGAAPPVAAKGFVVKREAGGTKTATPPVAAKGFVVLRKVGAAVQRMLDTTKPLAAPPVAPKGFVVKRKVGDRSSAGPQVAGGTKTVAPPVAGKGFVVKREAGGTKRAATPVAPKGFVPRRKVGVPAFEEPGVGSHRPKAPPPSTPSETQKESRASTARPSHLVVDASNVCRTYKRPNLRRLHTAVKKLRIEFPGAEVRVIADASLSRELSAEDRVELNQYHQTGRWEQVCSQREADAVVFKYLAKHPNAWVVSNDNYRDWLKAGKAPSDLASRQVRFHIDPKDDDFFIVESLVQPPR